MQIDIEQKTIIIVEDEPDTAEMFAEMMRLGGYQVYKTYDGEEGIMMISRMKPDVVILDVMMPDMSGLELLEYLRQTEAMAEIPVVVVSAINSTEGVQAGMAAGATAYLSKPVAYRDLLETVTGAIHSTTS